MLPCACAMSGFHRGVIRTSLFWDVTQRWPITADVSRQPFGPHLQGSSSPRIFHYSNGGVTSFPPPPVALRPSAGHGLLNLEVSRSNTATRYSRQESSGRVISASQRPLPDNTQHPQQTDMIYRKCVIPVVCV